MAAISQMTLSNPFSWIPKGLINNIPALVQIMASRQTGDKPLSEPTMVSLLTHTCDTRGGGGGGDELKYSQQIPIFLPWGWDMGCLVSSEQMDQCPAFSIFVLYAISCYTGLLYIETWLHHFICPREISIKFWTCNFEVKFSYKWLRYLL